MNKIEVGTSVFRNDDSVIVQGHRISHGAGVIYPTVSSDYVIDHQIEGIGVTNKLTCAEDITDVVTGEIIMRNGIESDIYYEDMPHE